MHVLQSQASVDLLEAVVRNVPAGSTVVLVGRSVPPLALAALRAQNRMVEVTTAQLSLDATEATEVVETMGVQLNGSMIDDLMRSTEGWPLGIRLVGGALADADGAALDGFSPHGDSIVVAHQYVEEEWLRGLAPADAEFVLRVSGLGWVSGGLCDHVLEVSDSGMRLERLHTSGLLVTPIDRRGESFRVHQVVRDALDASFARRDRDAHRTVHQRACEWFESKGDIDRVVEQALRVDDVVRGRLVIEHGASYHTRGQTRTVSAGSTRFPDRMCWRAPACAWSPPLSHLVPATGRPLRRGQGSGKTCSRRTTAIPM